MESNEEPNNFQPNRTAPENRIDLEQIEGRLKSSSLKKVCSIVEKHPDKTLSIIRNWMHQEN